MEDGRGVIDICRVIIMCVAATLESAFGGFDGMFITLIVFLSVDYISGVVCAILGGNLSSRVGAIGIAKKLGILCIIALSTLIQNHVFQTETLRSAVILYYISNEGISILENCAKLGIPIPEKLKNALKSIRESDAKNKEE